MTIKCLEVSDSVARHLATPAVFASQCAKIVPENFPPHSDLRVRFVGLSKTRPAMDPIVTNWTEVLLLNLLTTRLLHSLNKINFTINH
jgi:hypothetical protein